MTVKDFVQEEIKNCQEIPLAAWSLLLSPRQDFLNNHQARVPITPKQELTMEMREELLSSVGAQEMLTRVYQVSPPQDFDFHLEKDQLGVHAVFRSGIENPS